MTLKRPAPLLALFLVATLAPAGCSYQGAVQRDFNRRAVAGTSTKIPLRVGVVQSSEFLEKTFIQNGADRDMTITVQPALADAIYAELASVFETAIRLTPADIGTSNVDVLMFPTYAYTTIDSNRFFKTFTMSQQLVYNFTEARTHKEVLALVSQDTLEYTQPGSARTAAIVGIASMFLLTPITIPIETNALGNHAVSLVEASLGKMLRSLTDQMWMNRGTFTEQRRE